MLRKKLAEMSDDALIRRYAKVMGRTVGSVRAEMVNGKRTRSMMEDVIVFAEVSRPAQT